MTSGTEAVFVEALRLDPGARAELAAQLIASLDTGADLDADAAWAVEIDRRIAGIEAGTIGLESLDDVRTRIEAKLRRA